MRPTGDAARSPSTAIDVMIVDHQPLFRECLASAIAEDRRFDVRVAVSGQEALGELAAQPPDVLLVGLDAPRNGALELTREVHGRFPPIKVLLVGTGETDRRLLDCFEAGASGFVFRDQSLADLRSAIDQVARGEAACPPRLSHVLFSRLAELGIERRRHERLGVLDLTPRELQVLRLIADGLGNREIADRLCLSMHTIKNHVHNILERLGVPNRWSAVRYAVDRGWLP